MKARPFSRPTRSAPRVMTCVAVTPDEVQFDCPACDLTHMLTRGLDFEEGRDGVWRLVEEPGFACDCGVLIRADFTLNLRRPT
ncbi:MAG: hypothetical protein ACK4Z5_11430 [Brevundimonas sp.]